ncbi:HAD family hydrolase [Sulfurovum mangrovi]|uniref:HAD family hydrolase n=1 Tax=Sulfurovum mangrovi TaxID=2893889 RepID=UPI001E47498C|nr:HAD family hydrolase [Sulfurovum mangrovi]UFH59472.1 HAD family hydrolase [Sulfurovum mangrovi]UFH60624.1 HAD family hydrolase [Sulfurovum mangrovi]
MIILFDLDGTLIDSTEAILESFRVAYETQGDTVPESELIKAEIGHPLDAMFSTLGVAEERVWDYVDAYKMHYRTISCQKTVLLPNAREAVELASQYATLGVVTTKTAKYSIELLEHLGLMQHFEVLVGREDVENPKPHPEPIQKALEALPKGAKKIWMVGDTCMDMLSAKEANVIGIGVTCGYADEVNLINCTDYIHSNALEAVRFIANR